MAAKNDRCFIGVGLFAAIFGAGLWIAYLHADPGGGVEPNHVAELVVEARDRVRALERQLKATQENMTSIMLAVKVAQEKSFKGTYDDFETRLKKVEDDTAKSYAKLLATSAAVATQNEENRKAAEAAKLPLELAAPPPPPAPHTYPSNPDRVRNDYRCGPGVLGGGLIGECDPNGPHPCCSPGGWCGDTAEHCFCNTCLDYRRRHSQSAWQNAQPRR